MAEKKDLIENTTFSTAIDKELLGNVEVIKIYNRKEYVFDYYVDLIRKISKNNLQVGQILNYVIKNISVNEEKADLILYSIFLNNI